MKAENPEIRLIGRIKRLYELYCKLTDRAVLFEVFAIKLMSDLSFTIELACLSNEEFDRFLVFEEKKNQSGQQ